MLRVVRSGLLTTVQDLGRWGHQSWGVPVAGPMDPWAHRLANHLVGNDERAALLEVTLTGPELVCDAPIVVAVTGAVFDVSIAGADGAAARMVPPAMAVDVPGSARLTFGARRAGARAYLAIRGGIDVPPALGSRATHLPTGLGGLGGRALKPGDALPVGAEANRAPGRTAPPGTADRSSGDAAVRVMLGPHADWFEPVAIERLLAERFVVGGTSNRMAFRLAGPDLPWRAVREMVSEPTACGHVQVPPSGVPMLLMADRQTVGGYPTIATVIGADLGVAAQLAPGDGLRFVSCDRATAIRALLRREQRLVSASGDRARRPRRPPSADDSREATDPERFPGGEDSPGQ